MKKRSKTITTVFAVAMFVSAVFPAWAGGGRDKKQNNVVAAYSVYNSINKVPTGSKVSLELIFEAGKYYLKASKPNDSYTKYLIGCKANDGGWYRWSNGAWSKTTDAASVNAFNTILSKTVIDDEVKTVLDAQSAASSIRSDGFEIGISAIFLRSGVAAAYSGLASDMGDDGDAKRVRIPAYLPDGSLAVADTTGLSREIVVGLFPPSGYGDGLVFKRNAGMFAGEAALFNTAPYGTVAYDEKALALLYEFFKDKGLGDTFKSTMESFHLSYAVNWERFSGVDAETKKKALGNLATVLGNGFGETYREIVNGKSVFGSAKKQEVFRYLYGDRRNIYFDAYLAFCYITGRPVYASLIRDENPSQSYDPTQYETIKETDAIHEGKELAAAAMRFYTWGIEYSLPQSLLSSDQLFEGTNRFQSLFPFAGGTWSSEWLMNNDARGVNYWNGILRNLTLLPDKKSGDASNINVPFNSVDAYGYQVPFANGAAGYPIPYSKKGIDSPRTFSYKLYEQMRARYATDKNINTTTTKETFWHWYVKNAPAGYKPFLPGGSDGKLNRAGVDALGMLSGSVAMTGFYDKVYDLSKTRPGVQLDGYYAMKGPGTGLDSGGKPSYSGDGPPAAWNDLRLEAEDLEKISVPVPDLSLLQLGDLVVQFGDEETSSPTRIGIVVGYTGAPPQYRSDQKAFMEKVVLVTVHSDFRQVTLGTWGNPANMFGGFTKTPEKCHVRRILKRKTVGNDGTYPIAKWDVFDNTPETFEVVVNEMREQTRIGAASGVKERWIPNTGEYLLLTDVKLTAINAAGVRMNLDRTARGDFEIIVNGAIDRGYAATMAGQGNIYNNAGVAFEIALVQKNGKDVKKLGHLLNNNAGAYTLDTAESALYNGDRTNKNSAAAASFAKNRIWVESDGSVVGIVNGSSDYRIGIRPKEETVAHPGDDLRLTFGIRKRGAVDLLTYTVKQPDGNEKQVKAETSMREADYVATYDKKLLWRANLYIQENGIDWNDAHPWVTGNEWNRYQDGKTAFTGQSNLSVVSEQNTKQLGVLPGGQVVKLAPFTPLRSVAENQTTNFVEGKVSYSYPLHDFEAMDGLSGSMDSPFDFNKKMIIQKELLAKWYNKNGLKFAKPKDQWPSGITKAQDFGTFANYKANAVNVEQDLTADPQWYTKVPTIDSWNDTKAPLSKWWNYAREEKTPTQAFIPSLGLRLLTANSAEAMPAGVTIDDLKKQRIVEVGTDCIGFAKRAASYATPSPYVWGNIGSEWTAGSGSNEIYDVMTDARANTRTYPRCLTDLVISGQDSDSILYHTPNDQFSKFAQDDLKRIAPGDVFYWNYWKLVNNSGVEQGPVAYTTEAKDANPAPADTKWIITAHIGIVSSIIANEAGDITNIQLIESTYDGSIQYVQKTMASITYNVRPYHIVRLRSN